MVWTRLFRNYIQGKTIVVVMHTKDPQGQDRVSQRGSEQGIVRIVSSHFQTGKNFLRS